MSHTYSLFRDDCSNDRAYVHVNDDVITLSSLPGAAKTQQLSEMAAIRLADVFITNQITHTRIIQPYLATFIILFAK